MRSSQLACKIFTVPSKSFAVPPLHFCCACGLVKIFRAIRRYEREIFPRRGFSEIRIGFRNIPMLHPAVPRLGVVGEMKDGLLFPVVIMRLLLKEGTEAEGIDIIVFFRQVDRMPIEHLIEDVLVMEAQFRTLAVRIIQRFLHADIEEVFLDQ